MTKCAHSFACQKGERTIEIERKVLSRIIKDFEYFKKKKKKSSSRNNVRKARNAHPTKVSSRLIAIIN